METLMKTTLWLSSVVLAISAVHAIHATQISGKTADGKDVLLNSDGTWKYATNESSSATKTPAPQAPKDAKSFSKISTATEVLHSKKVPMDLFYDPAVWELSEKEVNPVAEFTLVLKDRTADALFIADDIGLPVDNIKTIILDSMKKSDPEVKLVREEDRIVNGLPVKYIELQATVQGIKFHYLYYVYTTNDVTVQLVAFTYEKHIDKVRSDLENLLNGLTARK